MENPSRNTLKMLSANRFWGLNMGKPLTIALVALLSVASWVSDARSQATITLGETNLLGALDSGNAGLLLAQGPYQLSQAATINSLSFYVLTASHQLRLGIYDSGPNHDCKGGHLQAQTNAFTPGGNRWNTANVVAPVQLPVGSYCLAYEPSSNSLSFRKGISSGQSIVWYNKSFGSLPTTFSSNPSTDPNHWSFHATLTPAQQTPTLSITFNPPNPSIPPTAAAGTVVSQIQPTWSDGSQFTGTVAFSSPDFSDGGTFAIDGNLNVIISSTGPGVSGDNGTVQNISITATQ